MKLLLIDSDFILWKCVPNKVLSESEIMWGMTSEKTLEETFNLIDDYIINKIFLPTQASHYIGYLGGIGNFRTLISETYKSDRIGKEFPKYFFKAKQYLVDKWKFVKVDGIEAEDAVGITLTKYPEAIIVSQDHDLKQLPGQHYNPITGIWKTITVDEALYNLNVMQLSGCPTDKVLGLKKGIGEVKAKKLLENISLENQISYILDLFVKEYGQYKGVKNFINNYKLLTIFREEDFIIPEIQEITCIPKQEQTDFNNVEF